MIHTGLPSFYHPFLNPLNWALQTQPSPPTSPPSSPASSQRLSSFSIDAILGRHHQHPSSDVMGASRGLERRREERLSRVAPYSTTQLSGSHSSIRENGSVTSSGGGGCSKAKTKRVRTIFTAEQLERLETEFANQQYMVGPERLYLAAALQLTEAQVKVWFQNRRIKWRKAAQEQNQARFATKTPEEGDPKMNLSSVSPVHDESSSSDSFQKPEGDERELDLHSTVPKLNPVSQSAPVPKSPVHPGFSCLLPTRIPALNLHNSTNFRGSESASEINS